MLQLCDRQVKVGRGGFNSFSYRETNTLASCRSKYDDESSFATTRSKASPCLILHDLQWACAAHHMDNKTGIFLWRISIEHYCNQYSSLNIGQHSDVEPEGVWFAPAGLSLSPSSLLTPVVLLQSYNMLCYMRSCVHMWGMFRGISAKGWKQ